MERKRKTFSWIYFLVICTIVSCLGSVFAYVNAYFTASAKNEGNMTFHDINLEINSTNANNTLFSADIGRVLPGDTLTLNNISVKNSGTADIYSLVNFDVTIIRPGYTDYKVNHWYNLSGGGCNVENPAANTTEATKLAPNASKTLSLTYNFDRRFIDNTFKNGKAVFTVKAVGIQAENLKQVESITSAPLIAAYMLIDDFYVPNSTNAVDYTVFETSKVVDCPTPTERIPESLLGGSEDYEYRIYNFSIQNVSTTDNMNVFVSGADLLCIMPGNHELITFLMNYQQGILPEGSVVGSGQGVSSFTLTSGQSCEFAVVTYGSLNITPTVKIYTEPQEDLPGVKNGLAYYLLEDKSGYSVACANPNITTVTIENTYNGLPVKEVAAYGFYQNEKIQSVTIGNNVETIGEHAFAGCMVLQGVDLGNVKTLGNSAFSYCTALQSIDLGSVEQLGECVFFECTALQEIEIPNSIVGELYMIFAFCSNLSKVTFEEGSQITILTQQTFDSCEIIDITIPNSVTKIDSTVFTNCTSLTTINLQTKTGYKWQIRNYANYEWQDCSNYTMAQLIELVKQGGYFQQVPIN